MRRRVGYWPAMIVAMCLLLAPLVRGQAPAKAPDNDTREVEQYTLTVDKVAHLSELLTDAAVALKANPSLRSSLDVAGGDGHASLDGMTAQIARSPVLTALLAKNSFAPREFTVMMMALLQASLGVYGKPKDVSVERYAATIHANPANLLFVTQHAAELGEVHRKAMALDPDGDGN